MFMMPDPADMAAAMEEQQQEHNAHIMNSYQEFHRFLDSLSEDQLLIMLDQILPGCVRSDNFALHLHGMVEQRLRGEFGFCRCNGAIHKRADHDSPAWLEQQA